MLMLRGAAAVLGFLLIRKIIFLVLKVIIMGDYTETCPSILGNNYNGIG
jgi:hypothetical protein